MYKHKTLVYNEIKRTIIRLSFVGQDYIHVLSLPLWWFNVFCLYQSFWWYFLVLSLNQVFT